MSRATHVPMRMCMGCGERAPQTQLVRITNAHDGALAVADTRVPTGRNGYLHRQRECWQRFAARKGLLRSLGRIVDKAQRLRLVEGLKQVEQPAMVRN